MPFPVRLLDPLPFTVTGVQHGFAFMLRLTLSTLLSLGRSTYLHRLMRYMVRFRLKYSLELEGWRAGVCRSSCRPAGAHTRSNCVVMRYEPGLLVHTHKSNGRVGGRYADDRTITLLCAERNTLHKHPSSTYPPHHVRSQSCAFGLRWFCLFLLQTSCNSDIRCLLVHDTRLY
jgi:hypothetical protein